MIKLLDTKKIVFRLAWEEITSFSNILGKQIIACAK